MNGRLDSIEHWLIVDLIPSADRMEVLMIEVVQRVEVWPPRDPVITVGPRQVFIGGMRFEPSDARRIATAITQAADQTEGVA